MKPALAVALGVAVAGSSALAASARAAPSVELDEHPGARVPAGLAFTDESGRAVRLGDYLRPGRPVVLVLAYYHCPQLCDLVLSGLAQSLAQTGLQPGRDLQAIAVSIDPEDQPGQAALKQGQLLQSLGRAGDPAARAGWPFLVGKPEPIAALAEAVGFRYAYDPRSRQFAHPAAAFVLTPDGRLSRYLYGVRFRPLDVRLALTEAASGRVASLGRAIDRVLLTCFRWDPARRRYGIYVVGLMKGGATLIGLTVLSLLFALWRAERKRGRA